MASLKIKKLTEKNTDYAENKKIPEPLPKLPARVLWVAASGSGKTLCLGNMLTRKEFGYRSIFKENIFLFSPTFELGDPSMRWDTARGVRRSGLTGVRHGIPGPRNTN